MTQPVTETMNETPRNSDDEIIDSISTQYDFGWHDSDAAGSIAKRGLSEEVVRDISAIKGEPEWMLAKRLKAYETFRRITMDRRDESPNSPDARFISSAFVQMGNYLLEGIPNTYVRPDPQKAFELYFYAASTFGDADGQFRLGRMFLEGKGTPRDPRQAARWLSLAAGKSHHQAQAVLGHMLFAGRDVPRAAPRGLMYLTLAREAATDNEVWINELYDEAMRSASDDERGVALRLVENWLKTVRR